MPSTPEVLKAVPCIKAHHTNHLGCAHGQVSIQEAVDLEILSALFASTEMLFSFGNLPFWVEVDGGLLGKQAESRQHCCLVKMKDPTQSIF